MAEDSETCITKCIHQEAVDTAQQRLPDQADLDALAGLFKLFGDSTRMAILWALAEAELCVCDLCALLRMKQPAVSHQLKNLKQARVVKSRRDGKVIFYSLDDDHISLLLNMGMAHMQESWPRGGRSR